MDLFEISCCARFSQASTLKGKIMTNKKTLLLLVVIVILSSVSIGSILFYFHLRVLLADSQANILQTTPRRPYVLQPEVDKTLVVLIVEERLPASTIEMKLKNTKISGRIENCALKEALKEICMASDIMPEISSIPLVNNLMRPIKVLQSFEVLPANALIARLLEPHGLVYNATNRGLYIERPIDGDGNGPSRIE